MIDPKVAEDAYHAWENFMRQVSRMKSRMLTAMAEEIDKQWADMVAETPKERHDEPTCCGERQKADVGEGWRMLGPDEVTQKGDEVKNIWGRWQVVEGVFLGRAGSRLLHRRRVTPEAPQSRPAETRATTRAEQPLGDYLNEENNELREQVVTLTAEVERLRLRREDFELIRWMQTLCCQQGLPDCAARLAKIADRHGGGE